MTILPSNAHLLLHLGEMTAQELRTAKAAYALAVHEQKQPARYQPTLDRWDFKAIMLMKDAASNANGISRLHFFHLWSERCGCKIHTLEPLAQRMLDLNDTYKWFSAKKFIEWSKPSYFGRGYPIYGDESDFWDLTFSTIASILMLTEVVKIPGLREFVDNND